MTVRASAGAELQLLVLTWPEMVKAAENHPDVMSCIAKEAQSHLRARRLAAASTLRGLSEKTQSILANRMKTRDYSDGEVIFQQGDAGDAMYFVMQGEVAVYVSEGATAQATGNGGGVPTAAAGGQLPVAVVGAGRCFGGWLAAALCRPTPHTILSQDQHATMLCSVWVNCVE